MLAVSRHQSESKIALIVPAEPPVKVLHGCTLGRIARRTPGVRSATLGRHCGVEVTVVTQGNTSRIARTFAIAWIVQKTIGLRAAAEAELAGIDEAEHAETGYDHGRIGGRITTAAAPCGAHGRRTVRRTASPPHRPDAGYGILIACR
jgi:ammonium transporter family